MSAVDSGHPVYIFFLGMPCSGKSAARDILRGLIEQETSVAVVELDDFPELASIFEKDTQHLRHVPTDDGGIEIVDPSVWSDLDAVLSLRLVELLEAKVVTLVEFARGRYVPSLSGLDRRVTDRAIFVYVRCSWDTAWSRNLPRRHADPDRYISRAQMESTFASDDYNALYEWAGSRLVTVDNDTGDPEALERGVRLKLLPRARAVLGLPAS